MRTRAMQNKRFVVRASQRFVSFDTSTASRQATDRDHDDASSGDECKRDAIISANLGASRDTPDTSYLLD
jgi:hypothetical protein